MADEAIRLGLDTGNLNAKAAETRKALDAIKAEVGELNAAFGQGAISLDAYKMRMDELGAKANSLQSQLGEAGAKARGAGGMAGTSALGWLMLSQAVEDSQFGIGAVVNNIPGIVMAFTGNAGLAAGASLAAVAINQLAKHWGDLQGWLGQGFPQPALTGADLLAEKVKKLGDELEELRKKGRLTFDELQRLKDLPLLLKQAKESESSARELESALNAPSKKESARGAGFKEAIAEQGRQARDTIIEAFGGDAAKAEQLMIDAIHGDAEARRQILDALHSAFGGKSSLESQIRSNMPETKEAKEQGDKEWGDIEESAKRDEERIQKRNKAAKDYQRALDDYEKESEQATNKEADALAKANQARFNKAIFSGRQITEQDVESELRNAGVGGAGILGPRVFRALIKNFEDGLRDEALKTGKTPEQAQAALAKQQREKDANDAEQAASKSERKARESYGGNLGRDVQTALGMRELAGQNATAAGKAIAEQLAAKLKEKGMSEDDAKTAAGRIVDDEQRRLDERLAGMATAEPAKRRGVETVGAAEFARKVQEAASGADEQLSVSKQQLETLKAIRDYQIRMERNPPVARVI